MHNYHHLTFSVLDFYFIFVNQNTLIFQKIYKEEPNLKQCSKESVGSFVRKSKAQLWELITFAECCVIMIPKCSRYHWFHFLIWACAFYSVFSIQMQYNIQSAIYTSRNCLHILIRPWVRDCCSSPFLSIYASVMNAHVPPSFPSPTLCWVIGKYVLWCTQFEQLV